MVTCRVLFALCHVCRCLCSRKVQCSCLYRASVAGHRCRTQICASRIASANRCLFGQVVSLIRDVVSEITTGSRMHCCSPRARRTRASCKSRKSLVVLRILPEQRLLHLLMLLRLSSLASVVARCPGHFFACVLYDCRKKVPNLGVCVRLRGEQGFRCDGRDCRRRTQAAACGLPHSKAICLDPTCPYSLVFGNIWEVGVVCLHQRGCCATT